MREIMRFKTPENGVAEELSPLTRFYHNPQALILERSGGGFE